MSTGKEKDSRRDQIVNAAYKEFSEHGFQYASTNRIVEAAGVSKGTLFYYFSTKEQLYDYLIDYGIQHLLTLYSGLIDFENRDLIDRHKKFMRVLLSAQIDNPYMNRFFESVHTHDAVRYAEAIQKRSEDTYWASFDDLLLKDIDTTLFRQDLSAERVIEIFTMAMKGFERNLLDDLHAQLALEPKLDPEPYIDSYERFLDDLRLLLYREGSFLHD